MSIRFDRSKLIIGRHFYSGSDRKIIKTSLGAIPHPQGGPAAGIGVIGGGQDQVVIHIALKYIALDHDLDAVRNVIPVIVSSGNLGERRRLRPIDPFAKNKHAQPGIKLEDVPIGGIGAGLPERYPVSIPGVQCSQVYVDRVIRGKAGGLGTGIKYKIGTVQIIAQLPII